MDTKAFPHSYYKEKKFKNYGRFSEIVTKICSLLKYYYVSTKDKKIFFLGLYVYMYIYGFSLYIYTSFSPPFVNKEKKRKKGKK